MLIKANLTSDDIDLFIPHQANIRIMESARERLGISKDKMSVSVNKYGNTSCVNTFKYRSRIKNGKLKDDDTIVLVGFGGGLTWGAMTIKWGK
ncbi:3-oxoacyl-[acyl-carrier-protein] synthase III C-terminal domain-containing protein [Staphylococcus aureus]